MSNSLVIIPTYNEAENIAELISQIQAQDLDLDILVVDDNSPDGTAEIVESIKSESIKVYLLKREGKLGIASAYIKGFKWALARDYQYIFEMDGDGSHQPKYLADFLAAIKEADLVLGSRYIQGGSVKDWGIWRKFISRFGSLYAKTILNLKINDLTGGFKCFRRNVLEGIDLENIHSNGYMFQIEMTYKAIKNGFKVKEIPIEFIDRKKGKSKISRKILFEAIYKCWLLRFNKK